MKVPGLARPNARAAYALVAVSLGAAALTALQSLVPEYLAAVRDALHDQDALRLREAAHKCYGTLSAFSTVAGDLAGSLEELAAGTQLDKAAHMLEQFETMAQELVKQVDGITVEALRREAEGMDEHSGTAGP